MVSAGSSRTQRSQRATQGYHSQSQRPVRGNRRAAVEDNEDEDTADDEPDKNINSSPASGVDADMELDRRASDLVRFALFMEQKRTIIRREDINKRVLSNPRSFGSVLERAQKLLKKTFAMELVELQSRNHRERDAVAGDDLQEARNATGIKKRTVAAGSKTYILRSTLHPLIIERAARTDERLYAEEMADSQNDGDDDEDERPRSYGSIISWSSSDQLGALGALHIILALILANGRSMTDLDLRANLKRLGISSTGSISMNSLSTHKSLPIDSYLGQLIRQGYIDRIKLGERKATAGKRSRAPVATQANADENQAFEWYWGHRSYSEIGEKAIANFVAEFMVERNRSNDAEDNNRDDGRGKGRRARAQGDGEDKKLKDVCAAIERAAGGNLSDIK